MQGIKSQNISNLKSFVLSLESESFSKKSELQQVVGSKYHDFIQSGHHIESMHEFSKNIETSVLQFDLHSQHLLDATKKILQYTPQDEDKISHRFGSVSSETVWRCLNECDISGAMIASLSALFILRKSAEKEHSSLPILKFLLLASRHANVKMQVKPNIRKQLTDASSLTENITDDAFLVLADIHSSAYDRISSLGCLWCLKSLSHRDLLGIYLHSIDLKLSCQFDLLDSDAFDLQVILDISKILQSAMLDIFSIFFDVKSSTINEWSSAAIERILSISVRYEVPKVEDDVINEIKRSCALEVSSDEKQEILKVLDEWTQSVALKISAVLIPHLTRMHNASEIAHAQQAIWKAYIHHDEVKMHAEMSLISVAFNQSYLDDACEYLFNQKARQKPKLLSKASKESSSGSQLLWANFFQKSFHEQIRKMLRNSCESSVLKIRAKFIDMLSHFGIQANFDASTAVLSLKLRDKLSKDPTQAELPYSVDFSSSSEFFSVSEDLVDMIEQEYASLFQAALFSLQNNSSSSDIFSFGLYVEVNVLTASLSALVRTIIHGIKSEIEKLSAQDPFHFRRFMKMLNGLICIARSVWLMQSRLSILRKLFGRIDFDRIDRKAILSSFSQKFSFSSYQIKSAFDIADTDGDGLLNLKEYSEALNALGVTEVNLSISNFFHTVTFLEFSMLCSHFALASQVHPISQLKTCLSVLVAHSHSAWAQFLSQSAYRSIALVSIQDYRTLLESSNIVRSKNRDSIHPSSVSSSLLKYLFKISHHFYTTLLSVDTIQTRSFKKSNVESVSHDDVYLENLLTGTKESCTTTLPLYSDGLPGFVAARLVGEALRSVDATIDVAVKSLFDEHNFEDSIDQVCLQLIYDLKLCDLIIKKLSDVKSKHFDSTKILVSVRAKISRIRGQMSANYDFNEKVIDSNFATFVAKNSYLLALFVPEVTSSDEQANPSKNKKNNSTVFATSSINRFQLLPLPLKSVRSNFVR